LISVCANFFANSYSGRPKNYPFGKKFTLAVNQQLRNTNLVTTLTYEIKTKCPEKVLP